LYALRSKLAHGRGLLQLDERPWAFSFNTSALQERESWTELYNVVREVLINWLLSDAGQEIETGSTQPAENLSRKLKEWWRSLFS